MEDKTVAIYLKSYSELLDKIERYEGALKKIAFNQDDSSCNELALKYEVIAEQALSN